MSVQSRKKRLLGNNTYKSLQCKHCKFLYEKLPFYEQFCTPECCLGFCKNDKVKYNSYHCSLKLRSDDHDVVLLPAPDRNPNESFESFWKRTKTALYVDSCNQQSIVLQLHLTAAKYVGSLNLPSDAKGKNSSKQTLMCDDNDDTCSDFFASFTKPSKKQKINA